MKKISERAKELFELDPWQPLYPVQQVHMAIKALAAAADEWQASVEERLAELAGGKGE